MSDHIAPHRWADAWAGRIDGAEREAMNRHADGCRACARARQRVKGASDSFVAIRAQSSPELAWDSVRAKVHWSVSTERRARVRSRSWLAEAFTSPWAGRFAIGALAGAAVVLALASGPVEFGGSEQPAAQPSPIARAIGSEPARPAAIVGLVHRATGDVLVDGLRTPDLFSRQLGPGTVLATDEGRVDIQFADASAFALSPHSKLVLRRFDASTIELVVDGTVDIDVAPRAAHQRFLVVAGDRTIEVRGTRFRVQHEASATAVACRHGLVAVRDRGGMVEVGASRHLAIAAGAQIAAAQVKVLTEAELDVLDTARPMSMPVWNLDTLLHSSAPLEIATTGRREVRLDGLEVGHGPMRVRVLPGRHTVEAADAAGRFRRAGWVDVAAPGHGGPPARLEILAEPPATRDISARRRELKAGLDQARLRQCVRQIAKQGLTGTYVQIELGVTERGAVSFLNVIDTDLGKATSDCVGAVLRDIRFGAGAAATWRERIEL